MTNAMMTIERFQRLAEAFGGDLSRWPADAIKPAADLARSSEEARAILDAERALDDALDDADIPVDEERAERVFAAIADRIDARVASSAPLPIIAGARRGGAWSAGFLSVMAILGMVLGALDARSPPTATTAADVSASAEPAIGQTSLLGLYDTRPRYFVSWNQ